MISYAPFWKTLKKKHISQYQLIHEYNVSTGTLDTLRKNKSITLYTLHDICTILDCDIPDVVEFVRDSETEGTDSAAYLPDAPEEADNDKAAQAADED